MNVSVWHPFSEKPTRVVYPDSVLYIVIADDEFMSTALYRPISQRLAPVPFRESSVCRPWRDWNLCHFTRWAYVSDLLNLE